MANTPTIVTAALDDKELQASINNMVANFEKGLASMKNTADTKVAEIQKILKGIGNTKFDTGGSTDGGSTSKQVKAQDEVTEAVKRTTKARKEDKLTLDQQTAAMQNAVAPKSARESYLAFQKGYKEQANQIAQQIRDAETALNKAIENRVNELNAKLATAKTKLNELNVELSKQRMEAEKTGNYSTYNAGISRATQAIEYQMKHIAEIQKQITEAPNMFGTQVQNINALKAEHERVSNIMKEEVATQQKAASATQQQTQAQQQATVAAKEYSEQVQKIAAEVRASAKWQKEDQLGFRRGTANIDGRSMPVVENLQMGLVLEEQIEQAIQRVNAERQKGVQITQQQTQASQQMSDADKKAAETLGWIEGKREKRRYVSPQMEEISPIRAALQSITGQQEKWIDDIDKTKASYNQLSQYLRELKMIHADIWRDEKNQGAANEIAKEIQTVQREMAKWQAQMNRPVSLNSIMGFEPKTLDDIAYKIKQLQSYKQGINLTDPKQVAELKTVDAELNKLQKDLNKYMGSARQASEVNNALSRSWNYMKNRLAFYFTVGASTQFVKELIDIRSQYEMNERALGILINSAERGTQIFNELSQMALVSPYTLIELSSAAKQLTAYDIAARDVVDTTRRLADMASAVGVPMERLTYALGQIKAYGYLNSRDARMFANAGIPLVKQLADHYTELEGKMVSTADVYDRMKKKAIDYNDVMQVVTKMTDEGGKFFDFQAKMADTLKVRLANLTLAWNNMLNDIGKDTQGVLTGTIGALRQLFLHWRELDKLIKNAAWILGIRTAFMMLSYLGLKAGNAIGVTTRQMALSSVVGTRFAGVLRTIGMSLKTLATSKITWWLVLAEAIWEAGQMIFGANEAMVEFNKSLREGAESTFKDISQYLDQYKDLRDSLGGQTTSGGNGQATIQPPTDIKEEEATKAWEAMREQIELSTASSDLFIGQLLQIENVSERLRVGFKILDDIQQVNSALKEMGDDAIEITQDWSKWWNLWVGSDGIVDNIKDAGKELDNVVKSYGSVEAARAQAIGTNKAWEDIKDYDDALNVLKKDVDKYTESLDRFIQNMGFATNPTQVAEVYNKALSKFTTENALTPEQAYIMQRLTEEARSKAVREALQARIADETRALKIAQDERTRTELQNSIERNQAQLNLFNTTTDTERTEWERFTKYLKENHLSEMQAMFRGMDDQQLNSINWQDEKYQNFIKHSVESYAKRHNMAYDEAFNHLRNLINNANAWQIFIRLNITTEGTKSVYDTLKEADSALAEANKQIDRLKKRRDALAGQGALIGGTRDIDKEYAQTLKEISDVEKDAADAIAKGGIDSKKDSKSKRDSAKAQKEAETELQKALKDELQLLDKVRSQYKKLTDAGVDSGTALSMVTSQFNNSITHINKILGKNGLPLFDIKAFAGTDDPNKMLEVLDAQLKAAKNAKNIKPSEIKDLEIKIGELKIDAKVYNTKKITEGLNNELGKLKDEYELAIELDANPELGGMFMDLFDIDPNSLPHSIDEYADRILQELNASFKERNVGLELPTLNLTKDDLKAFREQLNNGALDKVTYEAIVNNYEKIYQLRKKSATDISKMVDDYVMKYGDLQAQIEKIEKEKNNALLELNSLYNSDALKQTKEYLDANEAIENAARIKEAKASYEYLKKTDDYERFFTRINTLTTKDAAAIKAKIKQGIIQAFKDGGLTVNEFTKELKSLEKQFDELTKSSSGWVNYLDGGLNQLIEKAKETGQEVETIGEKMKIQGSIDEKDKNFLQSLGNIFNNGQGGKTDFTSLMSKFGNNMQGLGDAVSQAGQGMQAGASGFAGAITIVDTIIKNVHQTVQALGSVIDELDSVRNEDNKISNAYIEGFKKFDNYVSSGWENFKSGNISGAVADTANGIISIFNTFSNAYNEKINKQIKESEREVKRLENTYKSLENTVNNTFGAITSGAHRAVISNKQLQLVELERQLQLEKSRKKKNRDEDKIIELEGQIIDLRNEIKNGAQDVVNDLLGISSAGDEITELVDVMIEAFRNGEDAMEAFGNKWDEMIDNMILKLIVSQYMSKAWEGIMNTLNKEEEKQLKEYADAQAEAQKEVDRRANMSDDEVLRELGWDRFRRALDHGEDRWNLIDNYRHGVDEKIAETTDALNNASIEFTKWSLEYMKGEGRDVMMTQAEILKDALGDWYTYGENAEGKELSALQQGIQGITEETAGALEAYMNSVSQQVYLQSDILIQIRDAVVEIDGNATLATQAQMLLQLQQSYQVQQSIENILQSVLVPSGRAFAVELIS